MQAYSPLSSGAPAPGVWPESQFSLKTPTKNRVVSITENAREGAFGYTPRRSTCFDRRILFGARMKTNEMLNDRYWL